MTSTTDDRPDHDVCSVCGCPLSDSFEPAWTEFGPRCDTCSEYHPPYPPAPPLGTTNDDEEVGHCSASRLLILSLPAIPPTHRRLSRAA
jgi:hypothetical protein